MSRFASQPDPENLDGDAAMLPWDHALKTDTLATNRQNGGKYAVAGVAELNSEGEWRPWTVGARVWGGDVRNIAGSGVIREGSTGSSNEVLNLYGCLLYQRHQLSVVTSSSRTHEDICQSHPSRTGYHTL